MDSKELLAGLLKGLKKVCGLNHKVYSKLKKWGLGDDCFGS